MSKPQTEWAEAWGEMADAADPAPAYDPRPHELADRRAELAEQESEEEDG